MFVWLACLFVESFVDSSVVGLFACRFACVVLYLTVSLFVCWGVCVLVSLVVGVFSCCFMVFVCVCC